MKKTINRNIKKDFSSKIQIISYVLALTFLSIFNITYYIVRQRTNDVLENQTSKNSVLIYYWKNLLSYQPNYIDGWLRLAEIEYHNKNYNEALYAIDRASEIDPNSEKIINLRNRIGM